MKNNADRQIHTQTGRQTTLSCFMMAAMELRVVGTKQGTGIGSGIGSGYGVGALNIAIGAGRKIGTGTGRTVFNPPPVSMVSSSSVNTAQNTLQSSASVPNKVGAAFTSGYKTPTPQ